ncbi:MAG: methionyl-tRNA formyltransferase [Candidatus Binatia bacterium]
MGTPEYAAVSLRRLLATRHRVVAVVTRPDKPRGRGQQLEPSPVKRVALDAGIPLLEPVFPREEPFLESLRALQADLGVVVAYGRILPRAALDAPRFGCINAHASLLPSLRGAAPIERAILAGKSETGVTIMQMNEGLDEGDMLMERRAAIAAGTNGSALRDVLADLSADLLVEAVELFAAHKDGGPAPVRTPQDHGAATFAPPLKKAEAAIHWKEEARTLWLRVRAFAPRPGAFAFDGKVRLKVLEARPLDIAPGAAPGTVLGVGEAGLRVACGSGVLEILALQPEGKRAMSALDYARGLRVGAAAPHLLDDGN